MCGFVGVYEYGFSAPGVAADTIDAMRETLAHRGPDGQGTWVGPDARVGLGHRRLAIVDPEGGEQPMFGPDGECVVFNGEIYNYSALRASLEREEVRFRTDCDTEILLHLYRRRGPAMVESLTGMFAFALWDPASASLLLARDPAGEKPLYISDSGGRLLFGSEIKALLAHPSLTAEPEPRAIAPYLANLVAPAPLTMFKGVSKVPRGTLVTVDRDGVRMHRYRSLPSGRGFEPREAAAAAAGVRELLDDSIEARLMSDVPVGVLLSGGLDSSALVASLAARDHRLPTFSVGYEGSPPADERRQARRVAAEFGTEHAEVELRERQMLDFLGDLVYYQDEPLGDPVSIPLHFVCGLAREQGVKVVLAGEGADELFWGYPWYLRFLRAWPLLRVLLVAPAPLRRAPARLAGGWRKGYAAEILGGFAAGRPLPMHCPVGIPRRWRERLLGGPAPLGWSAGAPGPGESALETLALDTQEYELGLRLPELLLMRIDRFSMSNGVEARLPFLDPALVEYACALPPALKADRTGGKRVLRDALAGLVPDWVLRRPKQGFGPPIGAWLQRDLGALFDLAFADGELGRWIDLDAAAAVRRSGQLAAWPLLNLALWHRQWIQGEPVGELLERVGGIGAG